MTYADNTQRLARLLRDLASALEDAGVNPLREQQLPPPHGRHAQRRP
ncbi:hypothetical protein [Streptomyces atratus]|nr:hypothetical protein [Streptomyces atratus]